MGNIFCGCCGDEAKDGGGKGTPLAHDPDFRGPIRGKSRRPKDLLCLALFIVFIIIWIAIGVYAWVNGQPLRIIYPTDSKGRLCGVDSAVRDKPYLFFFDITRCVSAVSVGELIQGQVDTSSIFTCPTQQVCVDRCPEVNEFGVRNNPVCIDSVDTSGFTNITNGGVTVAADRVVRLLGHITREECAPYYLASTQIARRCVPTLVSNLDQILNLTASEEIQNATNNATDVISNFGDLFTTLSIQSITDGTFIQGVLVNTRQFLLNVYRDLEIVWPALLIGVGIIFALSFTYICLMRWLAGIIVWTGILSCLILLVAIAGFAYFQFWCFQDTTALFNQFDPNSTTLSEFINVTDLQRLSALICAQTSVIREFIDEQLPWFQYQEWTWLAIGIIGTLLLLILVLILIFLGKKIRISIAIIKEASKAVGGVPTSVFYPVVTFVLLLVVLGYWAVVALFLLTSSDARYAIIMNATISESNRTLPMIGLVTNGTACDQTFFLETYMTETIFLPDENRPGEMASLSCQFDQFITSNLLLGLHIYHLFGLLWVGNYVLALGECTLAGGFASWYWAYRKPKDVPTFALVGSFGRAILFHSGSLAFGALLIALVQLARAILSYIQKKLKGRAGKVAQCLLCCMQCCLWCLEKILKYINRQAYIEIAIYGYDFCTAACKAVKLLIRNILVTAVKDRIVAFLLFLGKLAITCAVGILAYLGFGGYVNLGQTLWSEELNYYLFPILFLVIAAYLISSGFMSVYHMAVDTIFICAMEDLERNNGQDKPYFMSKNLMSLLNVKNKTEQSDGGEPQVEMSKHAK